MHQLLQGTPIGDAWQYAFHRPQSNNQDSKSSSLTTPDNEKTITTTEAHSIHEDHELSSIDPKQWPLSKKLRVVAIISVYTFAVYAGSAIYIASVEGVVREYLTSTQTALLGLSLYVLGYGVGPLLWAPLSEVTYIGRNPIYTITTFLFLVLSIITATARSFPFFCVLRFLQGFFGSPCLANGGASLHDIFEGRHLPLAQSIWVSFAYAGPAIGPVMASYLVEDHGWRIGMWEIVACAVGAFVLLLLLPETYLPKVIYQHQRQQSQTKKQILATVSITIADEEQQQSTAGSDKNQVSAASTTGATTHDSIWPTIRTALIKPIQISFQDPAIAYVNIYTSYLYSCYYTFFDGFPMVYTNVYRFVPSHIGLVFLPIIVGCAVATLMYSIYIVRFTKPKATAEFNPEARLIPALVAVFFPPIGIFIFGWTAEHNAHWISGMIGLVIYAGGVFIILQCIIMYILDSYPRYAASLFAANDCSRSALAAGAVHFGLPLYANLGPGKACTVLGAVSVLGIVGMFVLYRRGAEMRARSRFTD